MEALTCTFIAYGEDQPGWGVFKHLDRLTTYNDVDIQVVSGNLKKCGETWAQVSKVLRVGVGHAPLGLRNVLPGNSIIYLALQH